MESTISLFLGYWRVLIGIHHLRLLISINNASKNEIKNKSYFPRPLKKFGAWKLSTEARFYTANNSTSNFKVALGGMTPPAPRTP